MDDVYDRMYVIYSEDKNYEQIAKKKGWKKKDSAPIDTDLLGISANTQKLTFSNTLKVAMVTNFYCGWRQYFVGGCCAK